MTCYKWRTCGTIYKFSETSTMQRKSRKIDLIGLISICLLILLFSFTGLIKVINHDLFRYSMVKQALPDWTIEIIITVLPYAEVGVAVLLLIPASRMLGLYVSLAMLGSFTIYVLVIVANIVKRIPCPCGGPIENLTWMQHLWFNILFLLITVMGIYCHTRIKTES